MDKYDSPENTEKLHRVRLWVQNEEYLNKISEIAETRKSRSRSRSRSRNRSRSQNRGNSEERPVSKSSDDKNEETEISENRPQTLENTEQVPVSAKNDLNDEILSALLEHNTIEAKDEPIEEEKETSESNGLEEDNDNEKENEEQTSPKSSSAREVYEEKTGRDSTENPGAKVRTLRQTNKSSKKKGNRSNKQSKEKEVIENVDDGNITYSKPPMSPELLIAIAVRNLDPHKDVGANCTDIVAFLSLHFPYFNDHYEECKVILFIFI